MGGQVNKDTLCISWIMCIFAVGEVIAILFLFHCCAKTCTRPSAGEQGYAMQGQNKKNIHFEKSYTLKNHFLIKYMHQNIKNKKQKYSRVMNPIYVRRSWFSTFWGQGPLCWIYVNVFVNQQKKVQNTKELKSEQKYCIVVQNGHRPAHSGREGGSHACALVIHGALFSLNNFLKTLWVLSKCPIWSYHLS